MVACTQRNSLSCYTAHMHGATEPMKVDSNLRQTRMGAAPTKVGVQTQTFLASHCMVDGPVAVRRAWSEPEPGNVGVQEWQAHHSPSSWSEPQPEPGYGHGGASEWQPRAPDSGFTTLAILNIPYTYSEKRLQWDIDQHGLAYDYFHLPKDKRKDQNRGFAIVNFLTAEAADAFQRLFQGRVLSGGAKSKAVTVQPSVLQGLRANVEHNPTGVMANSPAGVAIHHHGARVVSGPASWPAAEPLLAAPPRCGLGLSADFVVLRRFSV